jgi:hypothetical protein
MDKAAIRINLLLVIYTNYRFYIDWIDLQITALLGPHLIRRPTPITLVPVSGTLAIGTATNLVIRHGFACHGLPILWCSCDPQCAAKSTLQSETT